MPKERAFLDEITANPEYRMARLVYADWLEEKGDARAELIRIEEEMWSTPIWADRYWQLKPRRNELRAGCTKKWLDWMNYGNQVEPVFREVPNGWRERWRLLREFVERWHGIPMPDVGGHVDTIVLPAQERHDVTFPPSFREWIAFAYDLIDARAFEVVLRDDYQFQNLADVAGVPAFSLMLQAEGDLFYAVQKKHLRQVDPVVTIYGLNYDAEDEEDQARFVVNDSPALRLTSFVFGHVLSYLRRVSSGGLLIEGFDTAKVRQQLRDVCPVHSTFDEVEIFERQDMIAVLGPMLYAPGEHLSVEVGKAMSPKQVPAFLWDLTRDGGSFHGMFAKPPKRRPRS